jgi:WD40 repeat protein
MVQLSYLEQVTPTADLLLWDTETGEIIRAFEGVYLATAVAYSPDGRTALSSGGGMKMILWDLETGEQIRTFDGHGDDVSSIAFHPDGRTALSGSRDDTMILWSVDTGTSIRTFRGHTGSVRSVDFSPDGETALSGSEDGTIMLWDLATGDRILTLRGPYSSAAFSPDGGFIIAGGDPVLWDLTPGDRIRTFEGSRDLLIRTFGRVAELLGSDFQSQGGHCVIQHTADALGCRNRRHDPHSAGRIGWVGCHIQPGWAHRSIWNMR